MPVRRLNILAAPPPKPPRGTRVGELVTMPEWVYVQALLINGQVLGPGEYLEVDLATARGKGIAKQFVLQARKVAKANNKSYDIYPNENIVYIVGR